MLILCYSSQHDLKSIAFSALSTGVYGYPSEEAAEVAIEAVKVWLDTDEERASMIERIVFCQFMKKDQQAYEEMIPLVEPHFSDYEDVLC